MNRTHSTKSIITLFASIITIIIFVTGIENCGGWLRSCGILKNSTTNNSEKGKAGEQNDDQKKNGKSEYKKVKKELFWDFDSGKLNDLELLNVILKRADDGEGLHLCFKRTSNKSKLKIKKPAYSPFTLCFDAILGPWSSVSYSFSTGKKHFKIHINVVKDRFSFVENGKPIFEEEWKYMKGWTKWKIELTKKGLVRIYVKDIKFFQYFLTNYENDLGTSIDISCSRYQTFRIDNLSLK